MACAMASPVRLMRLSIRNTPTGQDESDSISEPARARCMKPKSAKGAMKYAYISDDSGPVMRIGVIVAMAVLMVVAIAVVMRRRFRLAPRRIVVPGFVEAASAEQVLWSQHFGREAPGDRPPRQEQRF